MLVALVTIIGGIIIAWMAQIALVVGSLVFHREGMGYVGWYPFGLTVADGTLSDKVIVRQVLKVAALAIRCIDYSVAEGCGNPGICCMAG